MFWGRIISILAPIFAMAMLSVLFQNPGSFYYYLVLSLAVIILSLWKVSSLILPTPVKQHKVFYAGFGALLAVSFVGFYMMLENIWLKWLLWLATAILLIYYFNKIFKTALISATLNKSRTIFLNLYEIIIIFYSSVFLFGLRDFINVNLFYLMAILAAVTFFCVLGNLRLTYGDSENNFVNYALITALLNAEIFYGISALSPAYYLKSFLLASVYLLFLSWRQSIIDEAFPIKYFKISLFFTLIVIITVLLTAKWF